MTDVTNGNDSEFMTLDEPADSVVAPTITIVVDGVHRFVLDRALFCEFSGVARDTPADRLNEAIIRYCYEVF